MGREFELKYKADPAAIAAIGEEYGPFAVLEMKTVYYDTPAGTARARHWTIRRRMENGQPVCTVKIPGDNGSRGEWEVACPDIEEAIPKLIAKGAPELLTMVAAEGLEPICGVRFTRLAAAVPYGESVLEIALDQGEFLGARENRPFAEVEVELKQGRDEDAVAFGQKLAETFGLVEEKKSKFKRALELASE